MTEEVARIEKTGKLQRESVVLTPEFQEKLEGYNFTSVSKESIQRFKDALKDFQQFLDEQRDRYFGKGAQLARLWDIKGGLDLEDYIGKRAKAINEEILKILERNLGEIDLYIKSMQTGGPEQLEQDLMVMSEVANKFLSSRVEINKKVDESLTRLTSPEARQVFEAADEMQIGKMGENYEDMLVTVFLHSPDSPSQIAEKLRNKNFDSYRIDTTKLSVVYEELKSVQVATK